MRVGTWLAFCLKMLQNENLQYNYNFKLFEVSIEIKKKMSTKTTEKNATEIIVTICQNVTIYTSALYMDFSCYLGAIFNKLIKISHWLQNIF